MICSDSAYQQSLCLPLWGQPWVRLPPPCQTSPPWVSSWTSGYWSSTCTCPADVLQTYTCRSSLAPPGRSPSRLVPLFSRLCPKIHLLKSQTSDLKRKMCIKDGCECNDNFMIYLDRRFHTLKHLLQVYNKKGTFLQSCTALQSL